MQYRITDTITGDAFTYDTMSDAPDALAARFPGAPQDVTDACGTLARQLACGVDSHGIAAFLALKVAAA